MLVTFPSGFQLEVKAGRPLVYLAGPFFSDLQRANINLLERLLADVGLTVYSPGRDGVVLKPNAHPDERAHVMRENLCAMDYAQFCVATVDDRDTGTVFEMGYLHKANKPVVAVAFQAKRMNVMLAEACLAFAKDEDALRCILLEVRSCFVSPMKVRERFDMIHQQYRYTGAVQ